MQKLNRLLLNANASLILDAYPTKVDVNDRGEGLYDLTLHYLTESDAVRVAVQLNATIDSCSVLLPIYTEQSDTLIKALQTIFSCHLVVQIP